MNNLPIVFFFKHGWFHAKKFTQNIFYKVSIKVYFCFDKYSLNKYQCNQLIFIHSSFITECFFYWFQTNNRLLRTSDAYLNCSDDEKINLLRYLLSAGQYNALDDLALLPLRNGTYIKFDRDNTSSCEIYMVPNSKIELLVGMEDRILSPLPKDVQDIFVTIVEEGERQY